MTFSALEAARLEIGHRSRLIDRSLLHAQPRLDRLLARTARRCASIADALLERFSLELRLAASDLRDQLFLGERLVGLGLHARLLEFGLDRGGLRLLGQEIVLELHAQVFERGFRRLQREPRVERFLLDLRVAQLEDHRVRRRPARPAAAGSVRRDLRSSTGSQRVSSGTSVPRPRTCRMIEPRLTVSSSTVAALDRRRRRFHARQRDRNGDDDQDADGGVERPGEASCV